MSHAGIDMVIKLNKLEHEIKRLKRLLKKRNKEIKKLEESRTYAHEQYLELHVKLYGSAKGASDETLNT